MPGIPLFDFENQIDSFDLCVTHDDDSVDRLKKGNKRIVVNWYHKDLTVFMSKLHGHNAQVFFTELDSENQIDSFDFCVTRDGDTVTSSIGSRVPVVDFARILVTYLLSRKCNLICVSERRSKLLHKSLRKPVE